MALIIKMVLAVLHNMLSDVYVPEHLFDYLHSIAWKKSVHLIVLIINSYIIHFKHISILLCYEPSIIIIINYTYYSYRFFQIYFNYHGS